MNEKTFQKSVVEPLFRAMGFRDVYDFSGGSLELGKDIVMWKPGELDERVNYGVVIKAVRISGKAKGANTASEVLNQVRQCLTSNYADPVTGELQKIHQCWVISSRIIEKSSIHSIEDQVQGLHFDKVLRWIHPGTNLFQLIEKYLPEHTVVEQLDLIQSKLDEVMKIVPYRIVAKTDKSFEIRPIHPNALSEVPFEIKTEVQFDLSTIEGTTARDKFLDGVKTGRPTEIEGKYIKAFKMPDFVPDWLQPNLNDDYRLVFGSSRLDRIIPLEVRRRLTTGEEVSSGRIDFEIVHHGSEEITLRNDRQGGPLDIEFIVKLKESFFRININCKFFGFPAFQLLRALKFCSALSEDGETDVVALDLGLKLVSGNRSKLHFTHSFEGNIKLLEDLLKIQDSARTPIFVPNADLTDDDIEQIQKALYVIKNARIPATVPEVVSIVALEVAKQVIDSFVGESAQQISVDHDEGLSLTILGNSVSFSPSVLVGKAYLSQVDLEDIKQQITKNTPEIKFPFKIVDNVVEVHFPSLASATD